MISTGVDGSAVLISLPLSSTILRTRPWLAPTTIESDVLRVPFWTMIVATGPLPLSKRASTTVPVAWRFGLALSSCKSAINWMVSKRSSTPRPVRAEISTNGTSPLYSSETMPRSMSSLLTRSGLALGLSILLMAMIIGTLAALAWSMASLVCGMTPSSAATTIMTMSVICAPRALMDVKASWPGVSRKVSLRPFLPPTWIW